MRKPEAKNEERKAKLETHSTRIKVVDMNVSDEISVREAMGSILAKARSIDSSINNAGTMGLVHDRGFRC